MTTIIVSAADENFAPLLIDLVKSLNAVGARELAMIGVLDLGLSERVKALLADGTDVILQPEWDLPVDRFTRHMKPYLRGVTARPFLPKYFPGFHTYLWLDADTWVQERFAIECFIDATTDGGMGLVSEFQEAFRNDPNDTQWRRGRLEAYFGRPGFLAARKDYFNSGVFSLAENAPHWSAWKAYFHEGLTRSPQLACDQTALNYAICKERLRVNALPAACNWLCSLTPPIFDADVNKLRDLMPPHDIIGLIHMTGESKHYSLKCAYNNLEATYDLRYKG